MKPFWQSFGFLQHILSSPFVIMGSLGLAQVFGLKSYKILLFPLALLIITFAIFSHPDIVHFHNFLEKTWTPLSLTICFF
ncbi:hypothetical protein [Metabacillus litoralis]|uniref:hypothetical protein n=1 Tax=Metabacillus litoralis TaxID=152268 RepID=UPI00203CD517|nr:hypothetical protein [Metabacillus litoralis]MCM3653827.1 hypothetical protein [Metabacillus litoralis]